MATQHLSRREQRRLVREIRAAHRRQTDQQRHERQQLCADVGHDWDVLDDDLDTCGHCGETRDRFNKRRTPPWNERIRR